MDYLDKYVDWLNSKNVDAETKNELLEIREDQEEIEERFYKDLEFGTGGLRGIMGAGSNRVNIYTVRKATQGLANYILTQNIENPSVAIAFDSRNNSQLFAIETAKVFAGNGIKAYIYETLRPTPVLSFTVRHLECTAGVVITASHNPPEYNGYKVYWSDGCQVTAPRDKEIISEVNNVQSFGEVKFIELEEGLENGVIEYISADVDTAYIEAIKTVTINKEIIEKHKDISIVYTPVHGSGYVPVTRVLKEMGYTNISVVEEQKEPNGDFPTAKYPNPEEESVFDLGRKLADEKGADLVIATDPDADRVGVLVRTKDGGFRTLSGNRIGVLLTYYILSQRKANGTLPKNPTVLSTIVSTDLTEVIAEHFGAKFIKTLTGFKYIGEKITEFEGSDENNFVIGFEESIGYLVGTHARDKDAVVASMLICEMACHYADRGMTLYDGLLEIFEEFGYYKEGIETITLKGIEGLAMINQIMKGFRTTPIRVIDNIPIVLAEDYKVSKRFCLVKGGEETLTLPKSDVLYFILENGTWACVRPSGTEPKLKIYFGVKEDTREKADLAVASLLVAIRKNINALL